MDAMTSVHALVKLYRGYGLGDAVQVTSILRHLRKHRPHWIIDYIADKGRHSTAIGLVRNSIYYDQPLPQAYYDREIDIHLYDHFAGWTDRPNTRVVSCLHERFGMAWDADCGRYEINLEQEAKESAEAFLSPFRGFGVVGIQYQGDSSQHLKNLSHEQAGDLCRAIKECQRIPLLLDWRNRSPLPDGCTIHTTGRFSMSDAWGKDAQMNAAFIEQCEAFIGIDSGPGKCAAATNTPSLIIWTWHHPSFFYDPAPNVTHLIPENHADIVVNGCKPVVDWFEKNYNWRTYKGDPVNEANQWLKEVLR